MAEPDERAESAREELPSPLRLLFMWVTALRRDLNTEHTTRGHLVGVRGVVHTIEMLRDNQWVAIGTVSGPSETSPLAYALLPVTIPLSLAVDTALIPVYLGGALYFTIKEW